MRTKLGLTDAELMNKSWIALCLESADFPFYDPKAKRIIKGAKAAAILDKYMSE